MNKEDLGFGLGMGYLGLQVEHQLNNLMNGSEVHRRASLELSDRTH